MLLPKGTSLMSVKDRLPPARALLGLLARTRFWFFVVLSGLVVFFWRGFSTSAGNMQKCVRHAMPAFRTLTTGPQVLLLRPGQVTAGTIEQ